MFVFSIQQFVLSEYTILGMLEFTFTHVDQIQTDPIFHVLLFIPGPSKEERLAMAAAARQEGMCLHIFILHVVSFILNRFS